jgi:type IV pilus assembly protein PilM
VRIGAAPAVGLDIGTSAVRAAQITNGRSGPSLVKFAQVAIPPGVVVQGEIQDPGSLSEAIAQLWKRAKLGSKRAVVGVANQRVVVRQLELPYLEEKEFRSSLRFQVADHIPMPVEEAQLDYQILDDYDSEDQGRMMRVLLVAAASDMVEQFVGSVAGAGLQPVGVDLAPFAVARAVSAAARGEVGLAGAEAIVDVGAGVSNIIVHQNGEPRFVRILVIGGDDATQGLADATGCTFEEAEEAKLEIGRGGGTPEDQRIVAERVYRLVQEIRGSIDYYLSREGNEPVSSVVVTGGGSLTPGLIDQLEQALDQPVEVAAPLSEMDVTRSGLTEEQVEQIEPVAAAAVGLALGAAR